MAHDGEETLVPREEPCALRTVHIRPPVSCAITELRITSCVHVLGFPSVEFSAEVVSVTLDVCAEKKKKVLETACVHLWAQVSVMWAALPLLALCPPSSPRSLVGTSASVVVICLLRCLR